MKVKYVVLPILLTLFLMTEPTPVYEGCDPLARLTFHFYHTNFWHLLANGLCLWVMKRIRWVEAYVTAVVCSVCIVHPTIGMSGVIFAAIGLNLGVAKGGLKRLMKTAAYAVVFGLLPGVSMGFHLMTLGMGWILGRAWRPVKGGTDG